MFAQENCDNERVPIDQDVIGLTVDKHLQTDLHAIAQNWSCDRIAFPQNEAADAAVKATHDERGESERCTDFAIALMRPEHVDRRISQASWWELLFVCE